MAFINSFSFKNFYSRKSAVLILRVLINFLGDDCLYSQTVMTSVLMRTNKPPIIDIRFSFSFNHMAAMGRAKNAIKKLESATCIASKFFNAVKNKIIDKKLWNTVRSAKPIQVLVVNEETYFKVFGS